MAEKRRLQEMGYGLMAGITVVIMTYNETANIQRCLESIQDFTDDIVIVDSFSTDDTLEICGKFNTRCVQHEFVNHGVQFNWALDNIEFKNEWILRLEADERLPGKLKAELTELVATEDETITAVYLNRRQYFMNRWLKHGGIYPHYILRLCRKNTGRYENKTEEQFVLMKGKSVKAKNDFMEDNRNNNMKFWLYKHATYSDGEIYDTQTREVNEADLKPSLIGAKIQRTRWFKLNIYTRAPLFLRAFLYFLYRYFIRRGFLDGIPGLIYFVNQSFWYRFYVDSRIYELRSHWQETQVEYRDI